MKKILLSILSLLTLVSFVACSNSTATTTTNSTDTALKKVTVAASPVPHAEILTEAIPLMKEKGYDLQVVEFLDYIQPNKVVESGEIDANYFQHKPYLDSFNEEQGTHIVPVGEVHFEPFGLYKGTKNSLDEMAEGDKIAVPNDTTNEARALLLLQDAGIIKLKADAGLTATKLDIEENPKNVEIVELESAQIPRSLQSVAFACMNANYVLEAGLKIKDGLYIEEKTSLAAKTYANIVCVAEKNKDEQFAKDLVDCLHTDTIKDFILQKYDNAVVPIG